MAEKNVEKNVANETPEEKFKRLATMRVNNALKKIQLIGNLSGSGYKYTPDQVARIIEGLKAAVQEVEDKFAKKTKKESGFSL
jgi:hypothetical protein